MVGRCHRGGAARRGGIDATAGNGAPGPRARTVSLPQTTPQHPVVASTWLLIAVGLGVLYLSAGCIIYKSRALPVWQAWVSWLLGLLAASFVLTFIALVVTVLRVLYVSILLATRNPSLTSLGSSGATSRLRRRTFAITWSAR